MPEPKFRVGDRVRLAEKYGTHDAGELFTVASVRSGTYQVENDSYLITCKSNKDYGPIAAYEFRFKKVEDKKEALVSDIKWKSVDYYDYAAHTDSPESPSRVTYYGEVEVFEIGTVPAKLPTKPGAIVAPPKGNPEFEEHNSYVLGADGDWYEMESYQMFKSEEAVVRGYLDQGWVIAFEGVGE